MVQEITVSELYNKIKDGAKIALIDVRTPAEFKEVHAVGAINIPLDTITRDRVNEVAGTAKVYFICRSGNRSKTACELYDMQAVNVAGGTNAWAAANFPVNRG